MGSHAILEALDTILLSALSLLFCAVLYFIKDLHNQFKGLVEKVTSIDTRFEAVATTIRFHEDELNRLRDRVDQTKIRKV